jgi:hypothetical protein
MESKDKINSPLEDKISGATNPTKSVPMEVMRCREIVQNAHPRIYRYCSHLASNSARTLSRDTFRCSQLLLKATGVTRHVLSRSWLSLAKSKPVKILRVSLVCTSDRE